MKGFFNKRQFINKTYLRKFNEIDRSLVALVLLVSILLIVYIGITENLNIYKTRDETKNIIVENIIKDEIVDENIPDGIKQEYKWSLNNNIKGEKYLAFYTVHQSTRVYFNEKLVYSLNLHNKKIGKTSGCNWVMIPVYPDDNGVQVRVEIIPEYKQVSKRTTDFYFGSKFGLYVNQFKLDLSQIILGSIAIIIGIVFFIISIINKYKDNIKSNLFNLGIFSISVGMCRLTDIRFIPMVFKNNTIVLFYTSILTLYISGATLALSIKNQFVKKYNNILQHIITVYCAFCMISIFAQILNIVDLREGLFIFHIILAVMAMIVVGLIIYEGNRNYYNLKTRTLYICIILCIIGFLSDLVMFYIKGNSSRLLFTVAAFIVYVLIMGYMSISKMSEKANIDIQTGLYNKGRCNEVLDENEIITEPLGIMMFDLNGLKHTNDTLGHDQGDVLISDFAKILKKNLADEYFAARYGGDEFVVIIKEADKKLMEAVNAYISRDVIKYNRKKSNFIMSYSMGYSLSLEYPQLTLRELLAKADSFMYTQKRQYYKRNAKVNN